MRIFLDTEFVQGRHGPIFLSAAFLTNAGHALYSEIPLDEARAILARHPNRFILEQVIPQLGVKLGVPWAELPSHLAHWLDELGVPEAEVVYDYNLDFLLVEQLLNRVDAPPAMQLHPTHVGYLADDPDGIAAAESCWHASKVVEGIGKHHALADVYALRSRFEAVHGFGDDGPVETPFPIGKPFELTAVVTAVVPEFEVVHAETSDGQSVCIGTKTQGVPWHKLVEGQAVICECLANPLVRVLRVRLSNPDNVG